MRRHHARVLGFCLSLLLNNAEAEDAAQEVFVKAYAALGRFTKNAAFLTWISRIASNHCLDILRKRKRQKTDSLDALTDRRAEEGGGSLPELAESENDMLETREERNFAQKLLAAMPPDQRQILALREIEGLSYEEIASVLSCTVEAVRARLRRARLEIQERARHLSGESASIG